MQVTKRYYSLNIKASFHASLHHTTAVPSEFREAAIETKSSVENWAFVITFNGL